MTRLRVSKIRILVAAGLLGAVAAGTVQAADFKAGWQAYQRGDFAGALAEWQPLAEAGDARAQFNLGVMYDEGRGVALDRKAAMAWWTCAGWNGDAMAQHNLALAHIAGDGIEQDYDAARRWLEQAAESGLSRS